MKGIFYFYKYDDVSSTLFDAQNDRSNSDFITV